MNDQIGAEAAMTPSTALGSVGDNMVGVVDGVGGWGMSRSRCGPRSMTRSRSSLTTPAPQWAYRDQGGWQHVHRVHGQCRGRDD